MDDWIRKLAAVWQQEPGANLLSVQAAEQALEIVFPYDYHHFLLWSDGGEGWNHTAYVSLWSSQELHQLNNDYEIGRYLADVVCLGTDGGSTGYGLQFQYPDTPRFVSFPLGDLDSETIRTIAASFSTGMLQLFALE